MPDASKFIGVVGPLISILMSSKLLAPDTPGWLITAATILFILLMSSNLFWGLTLWLKYFNIHNLEAASSREKWRWAAYLAFVETNWMPVLGIAAPMISPHPGQWPIVPAFFVIVWIVFLPILTLYNFFEFDHYLERHRNMRW